MMKANRSLLALLATTLFAGHGAFAEVKSETIPAVRKAESRSERKPSVSVFAGYAETEKRRQATTFGASYEIQPIIPFTFGAEVLGYVSHGEFGKSTLTRTRVLAKALYNFGGTIPVIKNSYVGLGLGPVIDNVQHKVGVDLGVAPIIGFDIPLSHGDSQTFSLGANASYMFVGGGKPEVLAVNGVVKYWF